jgi:CRISPR/Cas system-associated exonuclease Cas4 (RecB family)
MINKVGNVVHDIIQDLYNFTEIEKTIISEKYKIKGRIDGIKDNFVYEIKTIDNTKFDGGYLESHYQQGLIYGHILNEEYNYNIDTIVLIYVTRDLKRIIPFDLPLDTTLSQSLISRSLILRDSLDTKSVPEPIAADKEQCKWCSYKDYCEKDGSDGHIPFLEKKKPKEKNKPVFMLG